MEYTRKGYELALEKPCPECGGPRVLAKAGGYVVIIPFRNRFLNWGSPVIAVVCRNCGHTTFFVDKIDKVV